MSARPRRHAASAAPSLALDEIFEEALRAAPGARGALLDRRCGDDAELRARAEALLAAHDEAGGFLDEPLVPLDRRPDLDVDLGAEGTPVTESAGDRIGPYVLRELLGEGGFGVVYRAAQVEPVRREVALKILKLGMDTRDVVRRFQRERQALASTDHPNIARVLDAGATETGRPYFVMELVRGVDICTHADRARLDVDARLELFEQVCRGVQHAHERGLVHRDLKPGNVLVATQDGRAIPKVIDFGVAKASRGSGAVTTLATRHGSTLGTPTYMSPEQASLGEAAIDARSDVYTLGVLLYELLVGAPPLDPERLQNAPPQEIERLLREEVAERPSARVRGAVRPAARRGLTPGALATRLRGDLDWIVLRALEKERERRYATAAALADDVRRHLEGEPVRARPPSRVYRARRYVARHRTAALGMACTLLALVLGGIVAGREYTRAQEEARIANERSAFVREILGGSIPARDLEGRARAAFGDDHVAVAEALGLAAGRSREEGDLRAARDLLERSLAAWRDLHGARHPRVARAHGRLAAVLHLEGALEDAEEHYRAALVDADPGAGRPAIEEREGLARLLRARGDLDGAAELLEAAVALRRQHFPRQRDALAATLTTLWELLRGRGDGARATEVYAEMIAESRAAFPQESLVNAEQQLVFGLTLRSLGQRDEAAGLLREGLEVFEKRGFPKGESYLAGVLALAGIVEDQGAGGNPAEVDRLLLEAERVTRRLHGTESLRLAKVLERTAERFSERGELLDAAQRQKEALEIRSRALGESFDPGFAASALAALVVRIAQNPEFTREAYKLAVEAIELLRAEFGDPERFEVLRARLNLRLAAGDEDVKAVRRDLEDSEIEADPERLALLAIVHHRLGQDAVAVGYLRHAEEVAARAGEDPELAQLLTEARTEIGER